MFNNHERRGNEEIVSCETKGLALVAIPPGEGVPDLQSMLQVQGDIGYNSLEIEGEQLIRSHAEDVFDDHELDITMEESPNSLCEISQLFCNHERRGDEESVSCETKAPALVAIPPGEGVMDLHSTLQVQGDIGYNSLEIEEEQLIRSHSEDVFDDHELDITMEESPNSLCKISQVQFSKEVAFACALIASSAGGLYSLMTEHLKMKNHTQEILYQIVICSTFATFISSVVLFFLACLSPPVANLDYLVKFTMGLSGLLFVCAIGFATMVELMVN